MSNEEHATHASLPRMERKLAAILSADVKGYSRLMGEDEEATIHTLTAYREVMATLIQQHRGRVVDSPGDNLLAEFSSVVDAVRCGVEIQQELKVKNAGLPEQRKMEFRIGINLGDVAVEGERLCGDGVNIAARLESLAEPGGICIAGKVQSSKARQVGIAHRAWVVGGVGGLLLIAGTVIAVRYLSLPVPSTQSLTPNPQPPTPSTQPLPLPDKPSIVVLPFVNISKDPDQEYFSDGLTEVLTGDLSKISSLFVIARNSAFTYKGRAVKVQDVGREMGVRYVLEGSIQKANQQVRITAQLIEAASGYHLWSEQYDRPLKDIFALQDEIVQKIVTTLKLQLTLQEQGVIVRKTTDNLEAYDAFLRGQEYYWRYTKEANAQARQLFEKAAALDPRYAEAYAWMGTTHRVEWVVRWSADPQTLERALELAQQAVALDDSLSIAHSSLSYVYAQKQQYDQAIAEGERAIVLDPNHADSYASQAEALNFAGRPEEALRLVERAMRLNPRYPFWYLFELGWAYQLTGQYAEAIVTHKEAISRNPNFPPTHLNLAYSYWLQWLSHQSPAAQTLEPALATIRRALALSDSWHLSHQVLGFIYLYQQQGDQALAQMERAVVLGSTDAWSYAALAEVLSRMGRTEDALKAAVQALRLKPFIVDEHLANVGTAYAVAGHYEKARTPLQRFLSRYPNRLDVHLMLATVYSELGQAAEARAEAAEVLRINPNFSLEVHKQRMPIKDPAVLERHVAALHKAGLK